MVDQQTKDNLERLKANIEAIETVEEFIKRLQMAELIYAYITKQFAVKFPEAAKAWLAKYEE